MDCPSLLYCNCIKNLSWSSVTSKSYSFERSTKTKEPWHTLERGVVAGVYVFRFWFDVPIYSFIAHASEGIDCQKLSIRMSRIHPNFYRSPEAFEVCLSMISRVLVLSLPDLLVSPPWSKKVNMSPERETVGQIDLSLVTVHSFWDVSFLCKILTPFRFVFIITLRRAHGSLPKERVQAHLFGSTKVVTN